MNVLIQISLDLCVSGEYNPKITENVIKCQEIIKELVNDLELTDEEYNYANRLYYLLNDVKYKTILDERQRYHIATQIVELYEEIDFYCVDKIGKNLKDTIDELF